MPVPIRRKMVGAPGFEPGTFCTPSKRATSLRYAPSESLQRRRVYHGQRGRVNGAFPRCREPGN